MSGNFKWVQFRLLYYPISICILLLIAGSSLSADETKPARNLSFYKTHTHERLTVVYRIDGHYNPAALEKIDYILHDHRAAEVRAMDPGLMDFLYDLLTEVNNHGEVHIISGYRSPKTNAKLRQKSKGVAGGSLHMQGKALDFRLPGTDTAVLRDTARKMKRGGVGYYKKSDFLQIDTGRVRNW